MGEQDDFAESIRALRRLQLIPALGRRMETVVDSRLDGVLAVVLKHVPEYSASRNPDILPELRAHLADHLSQIAELLSGQTADLAFVQRQAKRYAEQRFPLDACLRAYRHFSHALAEQLRDDAIDVAPPDQELRQVVAATAGLLLSYANQLSSEATDTYVATTRRLAEADSDRKTELLQLLLDGFDESDSRASSLLRAAGYLEQRQTYAVIAVRSVHGAEMDDQQRVQRILKSLREVLHSVPARVLIGVRDRLAIAVISATHRQSGWTRPHTLVSELALPPLRLMGNAVLAGISQDVPSTAHIPRAFAEAQQALRHANRGTRVMQFADIELIDLILERARPDYAEIQPAWVSAFLASDKRGKLAATLQAYARNDMNVLKTAKDLGMHPNSMYARFAKIEDVTGLAPQSFHALSELLLALRMRAS